MKNALRLAPLLAALAVPAQAKPPPPKAAPAADQPTPDLTGFAKGRPCTPMWTLVDGPKPKPGTGPVCDPSHEKLTLMTLIRARLVPADATCASPEAAEYLRGTAWNDDPKSELFDPAGGALAPTKKPTWAAHFLQVEKQAVGGKVFGPGDDLLGRVHFGDLQPLHAMSAVYGESPYTTYASLIRWTEFLYRVAGGEIAGTTKLSSVPVDGFPALFPGDSGTTVDQLFGVGKNGDASRRALGALLHLVQETFLEGHALRQDLDGRPGGIAAYRSNEKHASDRHTKDAGWRALWSDKTSAWEVPQAREALMRCGDVAFLVRGMKPWPLAKDYFDRQVFSIAGAVPRPK